MTSNAARGYSVTTLRRVNALDPSTPVARFAKMCIDKDWSVVQIARLFGVSRTAVYDWFFGNAQPSAHHVEKMVAMLEKAPPPQA